MYPFCLRCGKYRVILAGGGMTKPPPTTCLCLSLFRSPRKYLASRHPGRRRNCSKFLYNTHNLQTPRVARVTPLRGDGHYLTTTQSLPRICASSSCNRCCASTRNGRRIADVLSSPSIIIISCWPGFCVHSCLNFVRAAISSGFLTRT